MKKIALLTLLVSFPIFAQINFESGYYTNNNNSKTECLIRNIGWYKNPTGIEYKWNENDVSKTASISEIKEFSIGNSCKYMRFKLKIDRSTSDINQLSYDRNPIYSEETLLLKVLVEGEANLYEYQDVNLVRFFMSTGNHETAEQLVFKEYKNEGSTEINENNFYKQQLLNNLKSDKLNLNDFKNVPYKKQELINLFLKFNTSKETKTKTFESKKDQSTINFKVIAGVNATFLNFENNISSTSDYTFKTKTVFTIGFEVENIFPYNQNKWSLFTNPNFQSYKKTELNDKKQSIEADYRFIELPLGVRYFMFLNKKSQLFVDAGIAFSISSKSNLRYSGQVLDISNSTNVFTGVGFKSGRYDIELRYNLSKGILGEYQSWNSNYNSIGILLGYKIL